MSDLVRAEVQDGATIVGTIEVGDVYKEVATGAYLRVDDWEVDEDGRRAWEMSVFSFLDEAAWFPKVGYVYESELADTGAYRLEFKNEALRSFMTTAKYIVPVGFKQDTWQHGRNAAVTVHRDGVGVIKVRILGNDLSHVYASIAAPVFHDSKKEEQVGRMIYVRTYTFTTLDDEGRPIDVEATLLISGKI